MQRTVDDNRKRIKEIDRLIERICEDNVNGKLSDERFMTRHQSPKFPSNLHKKSVQP